METNESHQRATLEQVASVAGVSKATASKVLNDRPGVAPATRRKVQEALRSLDYEPSTGPRAPRPTVVNVVFDTLINLYSTEVLNGILAAASDLGLEVVVDVLDVHATSATTTPLSLPWIRETAHKGRLGVVIVTTELNSAQLDVFRAVRLPVVAVDPLNPTDQRIVSIASTNFTGGVQATTHLLELGHRRIGFAGGPTESYASMERFHGFRSALESKGASVDPSLVIHGSFTYESGVKMGTTLLDRDDPPTAIFAGCDASAMGVYEAARRLGRAIPRDVSVVGFDDTAAALWSAPPLTTVRQPITELGRVAIRTLIEQAHGEPAMSHHLQLATRLMARESTGPVGSVSQRTMPTGRASRSGGA